MTSAASLGRSARDTRLPFTVLLNDTQGQPIEIEDHSVGLRMAVVERSFVHLLDDDWDAPGAYVLLDPLKADGRFGVYAGKAPAGIRARLRDHERKRDWYRALLIQRGTRHGMTSSHAGWLEGDLYQLFDAAERAELHNRNVPSDDTVPPYEVAILESFRDPIIRVLHLLGYSTDSVDADDSVMADTGGGQRSNHYFGITIADIIAAGLLSPGEVIISTNRSWPARGTVLADGGIEYEGIRHLTPSAAGSAAKDGSAVNGWDFWAVERPQGSVRLSALRKRLLRGRDEQKAMP